MHVLPRGVFITRCSTFLCVCENGDLFPGGLCSVSGAGVASSGEGTQLVGGGPPSTGLTAREAARQRWAGTTFPPGTATAKSVGKSNSSQRQQPQQESRRDPAVAATPAAEKAEDMAACPVCGARMAMAAVDSHLDVCLQQEEGDRSPTGSGSRLTASKLQGSVVKPVSAKDSDDDEDEEPLVKRRGVDYSVDQVERRFFSL
jgi:hypothetical protein